MNADVQASMDQDVALIRYRIGMSLTIRGTRVLLCSSLTSRECAIRVHKSSCDSKSVVKFFAKIQQYVELSAIIILSLHAAWL